MLTLAEIKNLLNRLSKEYNTIIILTIFSDDVISLQKYVKDYYIEWLVDLTQEELLLLYNQEITIEEIKNTLLEMD